MNFFGVGPLELVLILVLALIFLGPEELPTIARRLGKLVRDLQALSTELTEQVREELGPELEELNRTARELQEVGHKAQEIRTAVQNPTRALEHQVQSALSPSPASNEEQGEKEVEAKQEGKPRISTRPLAPPSDIPEREET